jgi:NADP-dependent 3-hydroxy acid dehydrogenase YdfG
MVPQPRVVALRLARTGVKVAASARSADALAKLAAEQPGITAFVLDVTDAEAVAGAVKSIEAVLGAIDLAIFSAGIGDTMASESSTAPRWPRPWRSIVWARPTRWRR